MLSAIYVFHWRVGKLEKLLSSEKRFSPHLSAVNFSNSPVWKISSLMNWIFFPSLKSTGYFFQFKLVFFSSFWARVKYFDGTCLTIYSLSTIYRDIHYQFLDWWIHYSHNLIVQAGKKIQFIKLDISNWRIGKIQCRQVGGLPPSGPEPTFCDERKIYRNIFWCIT